MEQIAALPGLEAVTPCCRSMQLGYSPEEFGEYAEGRLEKLYEGKEAFTEEDIRKSFIGFGGNRWNGIDRIAKCCGSKNRYFPPLTAVKSP